MSRPPDRPDPDLLFDLPLDPSAADPPETSGLDEEAFRDGGEGGGQAPIPFAAEERAPAASEPRPVEAAVGPRFVATLLDLVAVLAALGFALVALRLLEVPADRRLLAPLGVFLASFSFLYQVVPLAFWGHTPGMAYARIHARAKNGEFMTIQQCILRWVGWILTLATGGLAGLVALAGVSFTDLVSRTRTYLAGRP